MVCMHTQPDAVCHLVSYCYMYVDAFFGTDVEGSIYYGNIQCLLTETEQLHAYNNYCCYSMLFYVSIAQDAIQSRQHTVVSCKYAPPSA